MGEWQPIERQWLILRTLASRRFGATVRELATEFGVSQKTIRRDLSLLRDLGFPVFPEAGANGRNQWRATQDAAATALSFNISEILALYVSRTLLEPLAGTVVWDAAHSAFRKITASLDDSRIKYLHQLAETIHRTSFRDSNYGSKAQLIDDLMLAVEESRITFITYQSARSTEPLTFDVYPYGLVYHRGSLYLIANSKQHDQIRTFKVDRISAVAVETLKFQRPQNFNLQDYLQHSFGVFHGTGEPRLVVIRFSAEVARYVTEHRWHSSQAVVPAPDGSVRIELRLASLEEVKSWILSFGVHALVEEPAELRDSIRDELTALLRGYDVHSKLDKREPEREPTKRPAQSPDG